MPVLSLHKPFWGGVGVVADNAVLKGSTSPAWSASDQPPKAPYGKESGRTAPALTSHRPATQSALW